MEFDELFQQCLPFVIISGYQYGIVKDFKQRTVSMTGLHDLVSSKEYTMPRRHVHDTSTSSRRPLTINIYNDPAP